MTHYNLDHLVFCAPALEPTRSNLATQTGAEIVVGGQHPLWGTHNALAGLGQSVYFELLAPDPTLTPTPRSQVLADLPEPTLLMWAMRTQDATHTAVALRQAGYTVDHFDMSRDTPDGRTLRWQIVRVLDAPLGDLCPFFIDWLNTPHPCTVLPQQMTLARFAIETPTPEPLQKLADLLDANMPIVTGEKNRLTAVLQTPQGSYEL
jgi:hypothetical protein